MRPFNRNYRLNNSGWLLLFGLTLILGACSDNQVETLVRETAPKLDYLAPDFQLNIYGSSQSAKLSDFKGKPVLINFWQSSCEPCQEEMPQIAAEYHAHQKDNLVVLGINEREDNSLIKKYLNGTNFDWPMLLDSEGKLADTYGVAGFPTSIFVDRQGFIRAIKLGRLDQQTLTQKLTTILQS